MVNINRCLQIVLALTLLDVAVLRAKDLANYRLGDVADEDIVASVAFDAIDPDATAAKKADAALQAPVIFRNYYSITNEAVNDFLSLFSKSHKDFVAAINQKFMRDTLDAQAIATPDYDQVLVAFNKKNKNFPLTANLAKLWAQGDSGLSVQVTILARLGEALRRPITPDEMPTGVVMGETLRVVNMASQQESLSLADAEAKGKIGGLTFIRRLTSARSIFRRAFPDDEQVTARALQTIVRPTCFVDEVLTRQCRDAATSQIAISMHFDAGQTIIRRGDTVTAKVKAALEQIQGSLATVQAQQQAQKAKELALKSQANLAEQEKKMKLAQHEADIALQNVSNIKKEADTSHANNVVLLAALGGVLVISLLMIGTVWWLVKQRQIVPAAAVAAPAAPMAPVAAAPLPMNGAAPAPQRPVVAPRAPASVRVNIAPVPVAPVAPVAPAAPMVAPIAPAPVPRPAMPVPMSQPMVQEVAARTEPQLNPREAAVAEISQLVKRLDELRTPPHERVRTYEMRIEDFERELAQRGVQNPELLKLKIEALNCQIEAERKRHRLDSDWGSILN